MPRRWMDIETKLNFLHCHRQLDSLDYLITRSQSPDFLNFRPSISTALILRESKKIPKGSEWLESKESTKEYT